jgi:hypothetical protein
MIWCYPWIRSASSMLRSARCRRPDARVYANMLAPHNIRVNSIHPSAVRTPMIDNEFIRQWVQLAGQAQVAMGNALPVQSAFT